MSPPPFLPAIHDGPLRRQTIAHRILQGAALAIVENLMGGGLPYIQDRLSLQMMRPDLLRHHDASPPVPERGRRRRDRRSGGPSASSAYGASPRATPAIAASAPRRWAGRRTDRTDVHCCEDGGERQSGAWASPRFTAWEPNAALES